MHTIDKLKIFDSINDENPKIEKIGTQSIQITLQCGCKNTQHFCSGIPKKHEDALKMERFGVDRAFFVELCNQHKP